MHTQAILNLYAQLLAPNLGETHLRFQAKASHPSSGTGRR
jgi:hypothetical protein